jgi:hypothetical protein
LNRVAVGLRVFSNPESVVGNMEVGILGGMASTTSVVSLGTMVHGKLVVSMYCSCSNACRGECFKSLSDEVLVCYFCWRF